MLFQNITREAVGEKAYSLYLLKEKGFNVPDFFILPASFFDSWIVVLEEGSRGVDELEFDQDQTKILQECRKYFGEGLFAARSSYCKRIW